MRADRLLSIMLLLQVHGQMSARELARRLEVSERTIHRDMLALSASGVPVVAERGSQGGWSLLEDYRTNLTGLNQPEARALALSVPPRLLADLGLNQASDAAYIKLMAALPGSSREDAGFMRERIHVDMSGWADYEESAPLLPALQDALWQERCLRIRYTRNDGVQVEREVDPFGLVAKGSVWYLVAGVNASEPRTYRVSRIAAAEILETPSQRPDEFDLPAFWKQSTSDFKSTLPRYSVRARLAPGIMERLRYAGRYTRLDRVEVVEPAREDGWQTVLIHFEREREAAEFLLSFGAQIEVLEPTDLREKIIRAAEDLLRFYRKDSTISS